MTKKKDPKDYLKRGAPEWPYDENLANEICDAIATSREGLDHLCKKNRERGWPSDDVIYKWVIRYPNFANKYAHARELQQEVRMAYVHTRSADESRDTYIDDKGVVRPNMAAIARDKLITDNLKWEAARLSRKYREKQTVEQHTYSHEAGLKELE